MEPMASMVDSTAEDGSRRGEGRCSAVGGGGQAMALEAEAATHGLVTLAAGRIKGEASNVGMARVGSKKKKLLEFDDEGRTLRV